VTWTTGPSRSTRPCSYLATAPDREVDVERLGYIGMMDRAELADFLRTRREALQPEDVGLPRGRRRRAHGLRREEVAALCDISPDYYSRIEQPRGPTPSEQVIASLASGLHLSLDERDHLFRLAGYALPRRVQRSDHINPGMMRIFDRLSDTPALLKNRLAETLKQNRLATALLGDETGFTGLTRSGIYRWFTSPESRSRYPTEDHADYSRRLVGNLRVSHGQDGKGSRAAELVDALLRTSPEFAALWRDHVVDARYCEPLRVVHPQLGLIDLQSQTVVDPDQSHSLTVLTATPGTESYEKLQLLSVIGEQVIQVPITNLGDTS
jgi:transcriptional regulator with XRE-family HTH domain